MPTRAADVTKASPRRKPRVYWTDEERRAVVEKAADIREEQPGLGGLALLRRAQVEALPANRRRNVVATVLVPWFEADLAAAFKARAETDRQRREGDMNETWAERVYRMLFDIKAALDIQGEMLRMIADRRESRPAAHIPAASVAKLADLPSSPRPRDNRVRIGIVGPDTSQFDHISKRVGLTATLLYLDRGKMSGLPALDYIILSRHCDHTWFEAARKHVGKRKVVRLPTGGIETISAKAIELAQMRSRAAVGS